MVALQMHQEGLLDLDAPARDANPGWRTSDAFASASITPRDMMSHRTGLPRHDQITFAAPNRSAMMATIPYLPFDKQVRDAALPLRPHFRVVPVSVFSHASGRYPASEGRIEDGRRTTFNSTCYPLFSPH